MKHEWYIQWLESKIEHCANGAAGRFVRGLIEELEGEKPLVLPELTCQIPNCRVCREINTKAELPEKIKFNQSTSNMELIVKLKVNEIIEYLKE